MERLTAFGKALSDPTRVRILNILSKGGACVCELADALELSQSTLSTHLQVLRSAGVVATEKRRSWVLYGLSHKERDAVRAAFAHFKLEGPRIDRDNERFARRLLLRVEGSCVLGFGVLDKELHGATK